MLKRYDNLDLLKVIAILYVLILHTNVLNYTIFPSYTVVSVIHYFIRLLSEGVPVFVLVNGFLLFGKDTLDIKKHFKKIIKLVILFFVWSLIMVFIKSYNVEKLTFLSVADYVLLTKSATKYTGVLWFIQNLAGIYLLFPVLKLVFDKNYSLFKYLFGIVCFFTVGIGFINFVLEYVSFIYPNESWNDITFFLGRYCPIGSGPFMLFFMLGGIIFKNKDAILKKRLLLIVFGFVSLLAVGGLCIFYSYTFETLYNPGFCYCFIFTPFILLGTYSLSTFYVVKDNHIINSIIKSISTNTFGVFFLHTIVIDIVDRFREWPELPFIGRWYYFIGVLIISWGMSVIIKKMPLVKGLITL